MRTIVLISCAKKKLKRAAPAKDLYVSTLFRFNYAYARTFEPDEIFVLSAKHGLVPLDKRIEPYELTLKTMSTDAVRHWTDRVAEQLDKVADRERDHFIILAGKDYRKFLLQYLRSYEIPLEGLDFGNQLKRLKELLAEMPANATEKYHKREKERGIRTSKESVDSETCSHLHRLSRNLPRYRFPFDDAAIPANGIYLLFERGESGHGGERIVRVGSHTGEGQLSSRLKQHFLTPNKDRSIFRKNIGRALLNRDGDPFLASWELDLTARRAREQHGASVDLEYQSSLEAAVSNYIRENFRFVVFAVADRDERLGLEARLISTVSLCQKCRPSSGWLGLHSPKGKIRDSGLWLVNHLYKTPASASDLSIVERAHQPGSR